MATIRDKHDLFSVIFAELKPLNGSNPLVIIVPCHRVIGTNGSLTGFGGDLWVKQWLLEHERRYAQPVSPQLRLFT